MAGGSKLYFFTANKLYWIIVTFSGAVTYSQNEMSSNRYMFGGSLFTHMACMAAHRLSLSANPNAQ
jgi:hypothetical protein